MAQIQIIGPEALGKFPDTTEAGNVVAHDDSRHAETNVRFAPEFVERLQISEDQAEITADLDLSVVLVQLVDGDPDPRDTRFQQVPGSLPRQQRPVRDQFDVFPVSAAFRL